MARKTKKETEATPAAEAQEEKPKRRTKAASASTDEKPARNKKSTAATSGEEKPRRRSTKKAAGDGTSRSKSKGADSQPTEEQVRQRAYEIYQERGGQHGLHEDDWTRAERELREGR